MARENESQQQDALQFLEAEHEDVKSAFRKYESLEDDAYDEKQRLAEKICQDLKRHTTVEEEIFYPAFRKALAKADPMANEAVVEHQGAKHMIADIEESNSRDQLFDARIHVLSEYIVHHVKEEEQEMFPAVRKTNLDLHGLGAHLQSRTQELKGQRL